MSDQNQHFSIRNWHEEDRPREKLMLKGRLALSDAELLAILIGSGNRDESAVALCKRILISVEYNLNQLGSVSIHELMIFKGIGEAKAISIVAALELGRRRRKEAAIKKKLITTSREVFELLQPVLGDLSHEEFWIVYLNNANKVLRSAMLSKGGITGTIVDIRLAFKTALQLGAVAVILAHNHPSGNLRPSDADKALTKKLKLAGEGLDIKVLDHLIITENAYFSFADENLI